MTDNNESIDVIEKKKRGRKPVLTEEEKQQRREQQKEYMRERYKLIYGPLRDKKKTTRCSCGQFITESNIAKHRKSKKHINNIIANTQLDING